MTAVFFFVSSLSIVFFAVFLFGCSQPLRKSRKPPVVRKISAIDVTDSATGRRLFVHLEPQMAEFDGDVLEQSESQEPRRSVPQLQRVQYADLQHVSER
jgi:hypothetical protein